MFRCFQHAELQQVDPICEIKKLPKSFFKLVKWPKYKSLTLSTTDTSQPGCSRSSLTISARPCSLAHIKAVDPSSSCTLTSAPHSSSTRTISWRPWLTASINAVWPACKHNELCHFFMQLLSFIERGEYVQMWRMLAEHTCFFCFFALVQLKNSSPVEPVFGIVTLMIYAEQHFSQ